VSLLVAIHDVAPSHLATVARLRERLADWGVARVTLLAVPDYHGRGALCRSPATLAWLRARAAAGDEICLHGHFHVQRRPPPGPLARVRARVWTAGEGECLAQDDGERRRMLHDERRALEDALGLPIRGFVAPAWLEPPGFGRVLAAAGFAWHETGLWVERLGAAPRRWHTPVIGFATRTAARRIASLAWARALAPAAAGLAARDHAPARVALHPDDAGSPAVLAAAGRVVRRLAGALAAETYATALRISATRRDVHAAL
jgi:predicted deacetylase